MIKKLLLFILPLLLFSCTSSLFDQIATNNVAPDDAKKPLVKSFDVQDSIIISWVSDIGADEYILYRSLPNNPDGSYVEIYRGKDLSYTDNVGQFDEQTFFYYKIAKKRENKEFSKSKYSMGVVTKHIKDCYEDNEGVNSATNIDSLNTLSLNIYYCRDGFNNEIVDTDYFKVKIPAGRYYQYHIQYPTNSNLDANSLVIYNYEQEFTNLVNEAPFNVYNRTTDDQYVTFYIRVNKTLFLGTTPSSTGLRMGYFIIKFIGGYPINPQNT